MEMFADPLARRFYPRMEDPQECQRWIEWSLDCYARHGMGLWVVEHRRTGVFLGDCGLTYQPVEGSDLVEVGYHVVASQRGMGYATEAARACMEYAFGALGHRSVCSIVDPDNHASIGVASRLHEERRSFATADGGTMLLFWSERGTSSND